MASGVVTVNAAGSWEAWKIDESRLSGRLGAADGR